MPLRNKQSRNYPDSSGTVGSVDTNYITPLFEEWLPLSPFPVTLRCIDNILLRKFNAEFYVDPTEGLVAGN